MRRLNTGDYDEAAHFDAVRRESRRISLACLATNSHTPTMNCREPLIRYVRQGREPLIRYVRQEVVGENEI